MGSDHEERLWEATMKSGYRKRLGGVVIVFYLV
jgi:hypothetical protein